METTLVLVACAVMGVVIGSFLTVVVDRVPRGGSVMTPPSACGSCGHRLLPADLVPIASWVVLRGKCRHCGTPIGAEPLVIELATAGMFVLFGLKFGADPVLPAFCVLGAALVALVWIDLHEFRLPREITYTAIALSSIIIVIAALVNDEPERIWQSALGAGIALAIMGLIYVVSRGGMGDGDVRLAPLLGLHLGYLNPGIVPVGLFYGFLIGAVVGLAAMAVGSAGRKTALPFGPFLAAGTVMAVFAGQWFVDLVWQG
ncbi:MAG: prepilin peptidase [Ilumatobacter sp.]|uniref:prepilin peptidase n=1 Tax=Ilumatobacter sp. TaxID=1967498 RepID=UPI002610503C|nr:A24 family peptidase [Ilumatobacter sp.]MDJ0768643.1 prepilin peptidase [Ilumatobacter sp.]